MSNAYDRVAELRIWATKRIAACRAEEAKFAMAWDIARVRHGGGPPQACIEAWTERRTLETVLGMLDPNMGGATFTESRGEE